MLAEREQDDIRTVGEALAGRAVDAVHPALGGGNNRLFRLDCGGEALALKFYPTQEDDPRDRLGAEWRALCFMADAGIEGVPRPLALDRGRHSALYEWIDGTPPGPATQVDVDRLADFLAALQEHASGEGAQDIGPASAACFSPAETVAQLETRLGRITEVASGFPGLATFLDRELAPAVREMTRQALSYVTDPQEPLAPEFRALSPSDFGLHNALRRADGTLVFLDFEYFGWDDPVKAVADVMLHPGMDLPGHLGWRYLDHVLPVFAARDPGFADRFRTLAPLYALIWCLIILNEFLPERWARRNLGGRRTDRDVVRARQLDRARQRLDILRETHDLI